MICVICDQSSEKQIAKILSTPTFDGFAKIYLTSKIDFDNHFAADNFSPTLFISVVSIIWPGTYDMYQDFGGIRLAASLRRDHLQTAPIIFLGVTSSEYLLRNEDKDTVMRLVRSKGTEFVMSPWTSHEIENMMRKLKRLTFDGLEEIVRESCALEENWKSIIHRLGNYAGEPNNYLEQIRVLAAQLNRSLTYFGKLSKPELDRFLKTVVNEQIDGIEFRVALQSLDESIRNKPLGFQPTGTQGIVPNSPPKGYFTVLVADDMPQEYMMRSLEEEFGYKVIRPQALKLSTAKKIFDETLPTVVLADMYYKRSERETEIPDKAIGDEFIKHVLTHPKFKDGSRKGPILLVTSKAELDSDTEIRFGAINCSGVAKATDPHYIHTAIWQEALHRGITSPESRALSSKKSKWTTVDSIRTWIKHTLHQWQLLESTIKDTFVELDKLRAVSKDSEKREINRLSRTLKRVPIGNLTLGDADDLFKSIATANFTYVGNDPPNDTKSRVRDLLHNGIEQYSGVQKSTYSILAQIEEHFTSIWSRLDKITSASHPYEVLSLVYQFINEEWLASQKKTEKGDPPFNKINRESIRVICVEDNRYWSDFLKDTVSYADTLTNSRFEFVTSLFDSWNSAQNGFNDIFRRDVGTTFGAEQRTIAIIDLGIPASAGGIPHLSLGMRLLSDLASYKMNCSIVVFSSIQDATIISQIEQSGVDRDLIIEKKYESREELASLIIRFAERSTKYILRQRVDKEGVSQFGLNSVPLKLSKSLNETLLAIHNFCRLNSSKDFRIDDILQFRSVPDGDVNARIRDHIYRIRMAVYSAFRRSAQFIDTKFLLETRENNSDRFYRLNADLEYSDDDSEEHSQSASISILIVNYSDQFDSEVFAGIRQLGFVPTIVHDFEEALIEIRIGKFDLVWIFTLQTAASVRVSEGERSIETMLEHVPRMPVLFISDGSWPDWNTSIFDKWKPQFLGPLDLRSRHWLSQALYFSRKARFRIDTSTIPIVRVLEDGHDRSGFRLCVNGLEVKMNQSQLSKILAILLSNPKNLVTWNQIEGSLGNLGSITLNDRKNWTKRLRRTIDSKWLSELPSGAQYSSKAILESSSLGLILNVDVIF